MRRSGVDMEGDVDGRPIWWRLEGGVTGRD